MHYLSNKGREARVKLIEVARRVSGAHIGGSFSIIDFLITYYFKVSPDKIEEQLEFYKGNLISDIPTLIFSKGHCYLAQLAALDVVFNQDYYCNNYLMEDTQFFGHPKRIKENIHFPISAGALGQGVTFGNGLSLADKLMHSKRKTISILGDGEMNEGSCTEALVFAHQHELNHCFIIDNNNQISLGKTSDIYNLGDLEKRLYSFGLEGQTINGHDYFDLEKATDVILRSKKPRFLILNTIKGKGVSFMEGIDKWHHRRFKGTEFQDAYDELTLKDK